MSFNRPHFLGETLQSLLAQDDPAAASREVHLFQDGAINRWSRLRYARQEDIDACIALFRQAYPQGIVHYDGDNIGICENFCRAEAYFFERNAFETAWFFEDDMVLSPVYFRMMARLEKYAEAAPRVAYFSAYGDYYASTDEIAQDRRAVIQLDHHWAFGLRRHAWQKMQPELQGYYALVRGKDYSRRDHRAVYDYFAKSQSVPRGSSQDAAKSWAAARLGLLRIRTRAPFARYIGAQGAHMTQEQFDALGFAKAVIEEHEITDLEFPAEDTITEMLDEQRQMLQEIYRNELPEILSHLPAKKFNPMRRCTEREIVGAYQLLLNRNPETPAIVAQHVAETAVYSLIRGIARSREFQDILENKAPPPKNGLSPDRVCSEEEIIMIYNLLLHRNPDKPVLETREARARTTVQVIRDLLGSGEFEHISERIEHPW